MKVGSLFSGIGGLDLGLSWAGMDHLWFCEQDPKRRAALAATWPAAKIYGDVDALDPSSLAPVDLICGGFPCQGFSLSGLRKGTADDRYKWPRMFEIVEAVGPALVLAENVLGITSTEGGVAVGRVFLDLESAGYDVLRGPGGEPALLQIPAAGVNAPHIRNRIFFVGYSEKRAQRSGLCEDGPAGFGRGRSCNASRKGDLADAGRDGRHQGRTTDREHDRRVLAANGQERGVAHSGGEGLSQSEQPGEPGAQERRVEARPATAEPGGGRIAHDCPMGNDTEQRWGEGRAESEISQRGPWAACTSSSNPLGYWDAADIMLCHDGKARRVPPAESGIRLVADGVPDRIFQVSGLGDAVCPEVAYMLGRALMAVFTTHAKLGDGYGQ